jgi:D-alanyl-D-alanine carboxypeptidase/D-alanyl-D-alanine-endopeptidase (penicillin-binding protein 4)
LKLFRKTTYPFFGAVFLFAQLFCLSSFLLATEIPALKTEIQNGGYALSQNGKILYSANLKTPFIPASTLKLLTSLAALEILGPDFSFHTKLYVDEKRNLFIQGFGDPFLISEKVAQLTQLVAEQGLTEINNIVLDDFSFSLDSPPDGSSASKKPYDVNNSALAVNFNSLPLHSYKNAKVQSPEKQTPFIPLMGYIGNQLTSGYHRVNIDAFPQQGTLSNSLRYTGELFHAFLSAHGIKIKGTIQHGQVPEDAQALIDFKAGESVSELIKSCLLSSNNFMANQLYLALGVKRFGFPATWQKSRIVMNDFISQELKLSTNQITIFEGSGLSTKNQTTPEALITVLEHFRPYAYLIPVKYGTRMKSGTLSKTGVFCYAGYIPNGTSSRSFVILLNQKRNRRDQILKTLYRQ